MKPLFDDGHQRICGHGDPELGCDSVLALAQEFFDAQMLLDSLEKELEPSAVRVKRGDGHWRRHDQTKIDAGAIERIDPLFDVRLRVDIPVKLSCMLDWRRSRSGPNVSIVRLAGIDQPVN